MRTSKIKFLSSVTNIHVIVLLSSTSSRTVLYFNVRICTIFYINYESFITVIFIRFRRLLRRITKKSLSNIPDAASTLS